MQGADRRRGALDRRRGRRRSTATRSASRRPAGSPTRFLERGDRPARDPGAPLRAHPRAVPDRPAQRPATASTRCPPCASSSAPASWSAASCCPGGSEREWCDADVLRRVRRASLARAAPGGRGGRPARAGALPAELAERRRPPPGRRRARPPARGARPAAGGRADAGGLGARRAPAPARRLQPDLARPALPPAASWSGSAPARWRAPDGWRSTSARTSTSPGRRRRTRSSIARRATPHDAIRERLAVAPSLLARPGRRPRVRPPRSFTRRSGTWSGPAR